MKILKTFIDGQGRRMKPGMDVPPDYDKQTLAHYERRGMVGGLAMPKQAEQQRRGQRNKPLAPSETKPAAPGETKPVAPSESDVAAQVGSVVDPGGADAADSEATGIDGAGTAVDAPPAE